MQAPFVLVIEWHMTRTDDACVRTRALTKVQPKQNSEKRRFCDKPPLQHTVTFQQIHQAYRPVAEEELT
jgi:hypothetical protein